MELRVNLDYDDCNDIFVYTISDTSGTWVINLAEVQDTIADSMRKSTARGITCDHPRTIELLFAFTDGEQFGDIYRLQIDASDFYRIDYNARNKSNRDYMKDITEFCLTVAQSIDPTIVDLPRAALPALPWWGHTTTLYLLCPVFVNTVPDVKMEEFKVEMWQLQDVLWMYLDELNRYPETLTKFLL